MTEDHASGRQREALGEARVSRPVTALPDILCSPHLEVALDTAAWQLLRRVKGGWGS